ncbi:hypothetical protein DPMN_024167 [Dreissena polymorpha]|uniref:Sushi domain-containing protein n=1 Tax=Dreissena polymorpha TaxID=45954 RepID=A0A9D4RCG1_DREPO|nr:hypothetical protein DPMN_024167 [Dreissena polymorpha]
MTSAAAGVYVFDDVTHYECLVGYTNVSGVATRRCIKIDTWSGNTLVCTSRFCLRYSSV